jgi:hypothetical protein
LRAALHRAGAAALTELLQFEAPAAEQRQLPCRCGHHAQYQEIRCKPTLTLRITNEGHHWRIADGGFLAEWWPSSAKLVIGKKWHDGIHCHDYKQALKVIEDFYRKKRH